MRAWLRAHLDWESVVIGLLTVMAVAALVVGFGDDTAVVVLCLFWAYIAVRLASCLLDAWRQR